MPNSQNNAGWTKKSSSVELIRPPRMTVATGYRTSFPGWPAAITSGKPGFFDFLSNTKNGLFGNGFGGLVKTWWNGFIGSGPIKDLGFLKNIPLFGPLFSGAGTGIQGIFATWGGLNQAFAFAGGLLIAGLQATENHSLEGA